MTRVKPTASLSLDLDNLWSYMKTHGDLGWESFPSYLDIVVPRVLQYLAEQKLTITFFIVGQDAALKKNHAAIQSIVAAGHEIGNHSFYHEPWFHRYTKAQIEADLGMAETVLFQVTGEKPVGFRGPGYSLSETSLEVLEKMGYRYDASLLPTFIGPLARLYYFMTSSFTSIEKEKRDLLFGSFRDGLRPIRPFRWRLKKNDEICPGLIEIPVTTMPIFRVPFHVSYLLFIRNYSKQLAIYYFKFALLLCRLTNTHPSLLLHPLDFLGCNDITELSFFPAMNKPAEEKIEFVQEILRIYCSVYQIVPMKDYAETIEKMSLLRNISPNFSTIQNS
jgi:hypothetical protein